jgi:hypothetical protein
MHVKLKRPTTVVTLRLEKAMHRRLVAAAREDLRSLHDEAVFMLRDSLRRRENGKRV